MSSSRRPHHLRQPISCQPCRRRKIRCARNSAPCDTCQRRGCASSCFYENEPPESTTGPDLDIPYAAVSSTDSNDALVARVHALENFVRQHVNRQPASTQEVITPPSTNETPNSEASGTRNSVEASSISSSASADVGSLATSSDGYVTFRPGRSYSQLHLGRTLPEKPGGFDQSGLMGGFPFGSTTSTRAELLAFLPPVGQCDALLGVYFRVFSTVR